MALNDCLNAAVADGHLSREAADEAIDRYKDLVSDGVERGRLSPHEAELRAANRLEADLDRARKRRKRMRMIQADKIASIMPVIRNAPAGSKYRAASAFFDSDQFDTFTISNSVAGRHDVVQHEAWSIAADFAHQFRSRAVGLQRDVSELPAVVRALHGGDAPPPAKALADAYRAAREHLVRRFNSAGGDIRFRKDYGAGQHHDRGKIAATDKGEYVEFLMTRLDPEKMGDLGLPLTQRELRMAAEGTYDTLTQTVQRGEVNDFSSPINRHVDHRELSFSSADAWMEYQERFGSGDLLAGLVGDIDRLAREVAMIEVLGPYPRATLKAMQDEVSADGGDIKALGRLFDVVSGQASVPGTNPGAIGLAKGGSVYRSLAASARLGSAIFPSVSDFLTATAVARLNGLSVTRLFGNYFRQLNPADESHRMLAARAGYMADTWVGNVAATQRIMGEVGTSVRATRVADTALRLSGLNAHTEAARGAMRMEIVTGLSESAGRTYDQLSRRMQGMLHRHGITAEDWEMYRSTPFWKDEATGAEIIRPRDVYEEFRDIPMLPAGEKEARFNAANKIGEMVYQEGTRGVIFPTARMQAATTHRFAPGTPEGEAARGAMMFRQWMANFTMLTGGRLWGMAARGEKGAAAEYAATMFVGLMLAGAVATQASNVARGRDPLDMTTGAFWYQAALRGGAFGALGDVIAAGETRFGGGLVDSLVGPMGADASMAFRALNKIVRGENPAAEIRRLGDAVIPGSSTWYLRTAFDRLVMDQIELLADPDAPAKYRRAEQRARSERGQRFWWRRGDPMPERGPDLGAAVGG